MSSFGTAGVTVRESRALRPQGRVHQLLIRIRSEYDEMPGLCLSQAQAQRLWGLDAGVCQGLLGALVDVGYLKRSARGYVRA